MRQQKSKDSRYQPFPKSSKPMDKMAVTTLDDFSADQKDLIMRAGPIFAQQSIKSGLLFFSLNDDNTTKFETIASHVLLLAGTDQKNGKYLGVGIINNLILTS